MAGEKKRSYHSETREKQAQQTKKHILDAAKKLFQKEGFDRVTIGKIAEVADVSMPTIYAIFKSKRGILQALIDDALPKDQFTKLVDASMKQGSAQERLKQTAKLCRQMYDAERGLMDILRGASVVASEFKELEQEREARRYERQCEYVETLMKQKALTQELTLEKARDVLWVFTGRDIYRLFVIERGWTSDAYEAWLFDILMKSLLGTNES